MNHNITFELLINANIDGFLNGDVGKQGVDTQRSHKLASCSQIILANSKKFFKVNSLENRCRNKGTGNFPHL